MSTESKKIFFRRIQDAEAVNVNSMQEFPVSKGFNGSCEVIRCTNSGEFLIATGNSVVRSISIREGYAVPLGPNVQVPLGSYVKYGTWAMMVLLQSKLNALKTDRDVARLQGVLDHVVAATSEEGKTKTTKSTEYEGSAEVAD